MDPLIDRSPLDGEAGEARPEVGLVDLVDQALVRLDGLRDRPRLSSALTALLVFALAAGWGLTRWRAVEPIDDRIPGVEELVTADAVPAEEPGGEAAGDRSYPLTGGVAAPDPSGVPERPPTSADAAAPLVVHVAGAVKIPGLVELADGDRLADAVRAAGGPTATADVHRLNLATPVVDGMHIRVPEAGEEGGDDPRPLVEMPGGSAGEGDSVGTAGGPDGAPINVNRAGAAELERLPGIGPATAGAIIAWRDDNGPFTTIDDLLDVPGIGPAKLAAIEDQVTL